MPGKVLFLKIRLKYNNNCEAAVVPLEPRHIQKTTNWWYFPYFLTENRFDISCKLSPQETICIKCQLIFCEDIRKMLQIVISCYFYQLIKDWLAARLVLQVHMAWENKVSTVRAFQPCLLTKQDTFANSVDPFDYLWASGWVANSVNPDQILWSGLIICIC